VTDDATRALRNFRKKGYVIVSTASGAERSLYDYKFSKNIVLVLGAEDRGVNPDLNLLADVSIAIPGSGSVESLNVSSACAALLSEYCRQQWKR
jgi:tRNA G18 (ribose-2'-O)-methylase SpoU